MKKSRGKYLLVFVFAVAYLLLFVRIPKFDFGKSVFSVRCNLDPSFADLEGNSGHFFDNFYGENNVVIVTRAAYIENSSFAYANPDSDVVAKAICASGTLPKDPQRFYNQVIHSPDYWALRDADPNYSIILTIPAFVPTWANFFAKLFGLILIGGMSILVILKFK